eukprot:3293916-Rhodomonas_salina.1
MTTDCDAHLERGKDEVEEESLVRVLCAEDHGAARLIEVERHLARDAVAERHDRLKTQHTASSPTVVGIIQVCARCLSACGPEAGHHSEPGHSPSVRG